MLLDRLRLAARMGAWITMWAATMAPARAQAPVVPVDRWEIYGADPLRARDAKVPGTGTVALDARPRLQDPWARAASVALPFSLQAGERVSAVFWARADRTATVPAYLLARTAPYAAFAESRLALSPAWRRVTVTGTASAAVAGGSHGLSLHLGHAGTQVTLGPLLWLRGAPGKAAIDRAFAGFTPPAVSEDVRVPAGDAVLAATLRLPAGHGAGPFPVTLLLAGGGPSRRGVFSLLADRLLAQGIATFEYDKRGVGQSTGTFLDTIQLMRQDAEAAIAYLRKREPRIDPARIALLGLSQGGVTGPAIAASDPAIAALVTLAGPVGNGADPFMTGLRKNFADMGVSPERIDRIAAAVQAWMDKRVAGTEAASSAELGRLREEVVSAVTETGAPRAQAEGMVAMLDSPVLLSMYQIDSAADLAKIRVPVLALFAGKDEVVPISNVPAARAALQHNAAARVVEVADANHGFQPLAEASTAGEAKPAVSAPDVLELVPAWLAGHLTRPR